MEHDIFTKLPEFFVEHPDNKLIYETGGGKYTLRVKHTEEREYQNYLNKLENNGFLKYVDNGEEGINRNVFSVTYTKENLVVTVIHMVKERTVYIVARENEFLSDKLFHHSIDNTHSKSGVNTTLAMLELCDRGNCFVIQLKNGHFIISDGGHRGDLLYLLSYMEKRIADGEKPVVEAWFVSHPHDDHVQLFQEFVCHPEYADRLYVEGIYFSEYTEEMARASSVTIHVEGITQAVNILKTPDGKNPKIYHPQAGEKYYFHDITVDVLLTQEQIPDEDKYGYRSNDNENSLWLLFHIDGQTFLTAGDADRGATRAIMRIYDKNLFEVNMMSALHHGINIYQEFSEFCKVETLLYPHYGTLGVFKEGIQGWPGARQASVEKNKELHKLVEECLCYGDGTKILAFPYDVGSFVSLPLRGDRLEPTGVWKERWICYD